MGLAHGAGKSTAENTQQTEPNRQELVARVTEKFFSTVDHTTLRNEDTPQDAAKIVREGIENNTGGICIHSCHIPMAREMLDEADSDVELSTVVSFPDGQTSLLSKVHGIAEARGNGVTETDPVINIGKVKEALQTGDFQEVEKEIVALVAASAPFGRGEEILEESGLFTPDEIEELSAEIEIYAQESDSDLRQFAPTKIIIEAARLEKIAQEHGAEDPLILIRQIGRIAKKVAEQFALEPGELWLKTSTGKDKEVGGAQVSHVKAMNEESGEKVWIKAAGGIRADDTKTNSGIFNLTNFVAAGARRLGIGATMSLADAVKKASSEELAELEAAIDQTFKL